MFKGLDGPMDTFTANFTSYMDAEEFHKTLKRLRAGEYLGQVKESSKQVSEATVQEVRDVQEATQITAEASSMPAPQDAVSQAPTQHPVTPASDTVTRQPYAPSVNPVQAEDQRMPAGTLIDFDTCDDDSATVRASYAQSEAAELLSTLDPIEYELDHVDDQLQVQQAQAEAVGPNYALDVVKREFVDRNRLLLQNLIKVFAEHPANQTNLGAFTMVNGLQQCVWSQAMEDQCGLDEATKEELLKEVWGDFQPVGVDNSTNDPRSAPDSPTHLPDTPRPRPSTASAAPRENTRVPAPTVAAITPHETARASPPGVTTQARRRVYRRSSLVSLYDNRLQPPHWLRELGFMPEFSRRNQPPSVCQSLEDKLSTVEPFVPPPLPAAAYLPLDLSKSRASAAWVMATEGPSTLGSTATITSESTAQGVPYGASENVEPTPSIASEATIREAHAEVQDVQINVTNKTTLPETTASSSRQEHGATDIPKVPELICLAVPEPARPPSTQGNIRGLQSSRWARPGDRLETAGAFTGPQFLSGAILRDLAQLQPQERVTATPAQLADMFSVKPSDQSTEHVAPGVAPPQQEDKPAAVPDDQPVTPSNTVNLGLAGSRFARGPTPENTSGINSPAAGAQLQAPAVESQPPAPAPRPINRGLAGSRFASGNVLPSSGSFTGLYAPRR